MRDRARRSSLLGAAFGLAALGLGLFFFLDRPSPPAQTLITGSAERAPGSAASSVPAPSVAPPPSLDPPQNEPGTPPHAPPPGPACQRDEDCTGPRSPDCVRAHCVDQHCVYDDRSCGCASNEECDDRDPCTRDLCFARTRACVHVQDGCADTKPPK